MTSMMIRGRGSLSMEYRTGWGTKNLGLSGRMHEVNVRGVEAMDLNDA